MNGSIRLATVLTLAFVWLLPSTFAAHAQEPTARYKITFDATWDADTPHPHPDGVDDFPGAQAHFSSLIGGVHNSNVRFWQVGQLASAGIEAMAELGATAALRSEVENAIGNSSALAVITGTNVFPSPDVAVIPEVQVTLAYSQVTLVTMIAPSPDWFVGVSGLSLIENGEWVESKSVVLHAYDAGTEDGTGFSLANSDTVPLQAIQSLSDHKLGTFTFTRLDDLNYRLYVPWVSR